MGPSKSNRIIYMSRVFTSASSMYGSLSLPATYSAPFTIACRYIPSATGTFGIVTALGTSYASIVTHGGFYKISTAATLVATSIAPVNGTQVNLVLVVASATSRTLYIDGVSRATDATSETITGATFVVGRENAAFYVSGTIQDAAFWNRALTVTDAITFHRGCSPLLMPQSLKAYVPLWGNNSPEPNYCGTAVTLFNSPTKGTAMRTIL